MSIFQSSNTLPNTRYSDILIPILIHTLLVRVVLVVVFSFLFSFLIPILVHIHISSGKDVYCVSYSPVDDIIQPRRSIFPTISIRFSQNH